VRVESTANAADQQAAAIGRLCRERDADVTLLAGDEERAVWQEHDDRVWGRDSDDSEERAVASSVATISVLPTRVREALDAAARAVGDAGLEWRAGGRAALGVVLIAATGDPARHAIALGRVGAAVHGLGGTIAVRSQVPDVERVSTAVGAAEQ